MVVEAFFYMFVVCLGGSMGVAATFFISWNIFKRLETGKRKEKKRIAA